MESAKPEISIDYQNLQTCYIPAEDKTIHPFTLVIFGGAGDLSQRKLLPPLLISNKTRGLGIL